MILVTGGSGTLGGAVLAEIARSGIAVRAMYRSPAHAAKAPAGVETVIADFADMDSLSRAMNGVGGLYIVCGPVPDLVALEGNAIAAAEAAGVKRIVLTSALGAADYPRSFPSWHRTVEDRLKATGIAHCILRPNGFSQNILTYFAPSIRAQGAFYGAMGDARTSYVDVRDIAAVAAAALLDPAHEGQVYELNGPEALSYGDVARMISRHAGIEARYVDIPETAQRAAMLGQGMPEWQVTALLDLQRYYTGGQGGTVDGVLAGLLGRAPRTVDQFLAENAGAFAGPTAAA
jgi:uncharacterized protein YbjT (DUF2867 family)